MFLLTKPMELIIRKPAEMILRVFFYFPSYQREPAGRSVHRYTRSRTLIKKESGLPTNKAQLVGQRQPRGFSYVIMFTLYHLSLTRVSRSVITDPYLSVTTVSRVMSSFSAYAMYLSHSSYVSISEEIRPVVL